MSPEDYERWVSGSHAPAVRELPSEEDRRNHRVGGMLGSDPPHRYVVTTEFSDPEHLGEDVGGEETRGLLAELHEYAEVTRLVTERFA